MAKTTSFREKNRDVLGTMYPVPSSLDGESSIIGSLILDNDKWDLVASMLSTKDFHYSKHRIIFKEIQNLFSKRTPFDIVTLSESLLNKNLLDEVGGLAYLAEIVRNTPTTSNIEAYTKIVIEYARLRELLNISAQIAEMVQSPEGKNFNDMLGLIEQKILSVGNTQSRFNNSPKSIPDILPKVVNKIDAIMESKDGISGLSTGFSDLDEITSGIHNSNLVIIAGRPSMGKTTFAMNIVENIARGSKKPVLVFSLEMPSEDILLRMISSLGKIDQSNIRKGRLDDKEWERVTSTMEFLSMDINIFIDDSSSLNPSEIRARSRSIYREHGGLEMIVIDYLQLIKIPGYENNRTQEVSEISRSLKALSKELNLPVIAISQLNRNVDDRFDKRPLMSDLRESGAIEQDADVIMFVYRDEVYNRNTKENKGLGDIIISKQRNGPIGNIKLYFEGKFCRFADFSSEKSVPISVY